jgi:U3 small nucleolar RNA-associated protein 12
LALHFARKLTVPLVETAGNSKAKSFAMIPSKDEGNLKVLVAFHSNTAFEYKIDLVQSKEEGVDASTVAKVKTSFGQMTSHRMPIRGVALSANDSIFATNSFDSVKVWSVDLFMYSQKNSLQLQCKQSIDEPSILSMAILPGNKYIVLGTKEGQLLLYELNSNSIV